MPKTPNISLKQLDPKDLKPAAYNPRKIGEAERAALLRGVAEFGMVDPIVARAEDLMVLGGHQRLSVAIELGLASVPVVLLPGLDNDRAAAINILLNNPRAQGAWDMKALSDVLSELDAHGFDATLTGFTDDELGEILGHIPSIGFGGLPDGDKSPFEQMTFTLSSDQADMVREAMDAARTAGPFINTGNDNSNGNALARVAELSLRAVRA